MRVRAPIAALLLSLAAASASCVGVIGTDRELALPVRSGFESVADALQPSCATLDCHGQAERNLRLFGARGLRLQAMDNAKEGTTQPAEYEANYWSLVSLEPETLAAVIRDGGGDPERLILIRKGRGTTRHKGGALMRPDDNLDQCLTAWLRGEILSDPCRAAAKISAPDPPTAAP